jgi:hypothetical protein
LTISKSLRAEYKSDELRKKIKGIDEKLSSLDKKLNNERLEDKEHEKIEQQIQTLKSELGNTQSELASTSNPAHKMLADRMAERDPGNAPASGDRIPYIYVQASTGQIAPTLQGERIETPSYIKEKGLKPDYMYYIDHQISNPLCQLFGVVVEQIPGFDVYPAPKGGWCKTLPDALIVQRETAAYHLLFGDAIASNNKGNKRAFAKLLGAELHSIGTSNETKLPKSSVQTRSMAQTAQMAQPPVKKQTLLDSMFIASVKLDASKEATKAAKASKKTSTS